MELDMSFYIYLTNSKYYAEEIFHVNPELCYFILVVEDYFILKYAKEKLKSKAIPSSSGKKLKKVKVDGGTYDVIDSTATTDNQKSFQPSKNETSLTNLLTEPEIEDNVITEEYNKVRIT